MEEPHSYSNFTAHARKSEHHKSDRVGHISCYIIQENMFHMNTFVESLKETNKIETSYMFGLFKFMLLGLLGEKMVYKKQVNVISSNILEGCGWGKSCDHLL